MNIHVISLGCPKNLVDTEMMLARLVRRNHRLVSEQDDAELILVNTCAFTDEAVAESREVLDGLARLKQERPELRIVVAGCLAQAGKRVSRLRSPGASRWWGSSVGRHLVTFPHSAYLKIAEGCDHRCSFCIIPQLRGPYCSKPLDLLVDEARGLAEVGVRELILVAEDTTCYGVDLSGISLLGDLLTRLADVDGIHWIRLLYCHPDHLTQDMIDVVREEEKVVKYLDLPVQHFSTQLLRSMQRARGGSEISDMIAGLRTAIPGLTLRTSVLVGYPGEGPGEFEGLCSAVRELTFDHLGVFIFSPQEGTEAATLPDQVPEHVREARRDRLMSIQQEIAFVRSRSQVGKVVEVLVDRHFGGGADDRHGGYSAVGRTAGDAPEIDGVIYLRGAAPMPGEFCQARITDGLGYDLAGEVISRQQDP
ncbi:hypothetical protein AMJ82_09355 [candidate division TA06 bacterium SM23_40]|uniref:Ribosomal protein uS12 methylthiotransferase RimO n=1 Tax=candidate division TA06 bacterium SM23_40 TaxID=1703774 RepID=A0A0S8G4Q1_UNCT6|nr:MAG: hypothetical protein AMJ82_09355 [candidate division TA06 bacterium SM23_40]